MNLARRTGRAWLRAAGTAVIALIGCLQPATSLAAVPEDAWNAATCSSGGCHGATVQTTAADDPRSRILLFLSERFSTSWCLPGHVGNGTPMCSSNGIYFTAPGATDLSGVYDYVVAARDTIVKGGGGSVDTLDAFPLTGFSGPASTQSVTLSNYRDEALDFSATISVNGSDYSVVNDNCAAGAGSSLRVNAAIVVGGNTSPSSCRITVRFLPAASSTVARAGTLRIAFTAWSTVQPRTRDIALSGQARFPDYTAGGFNNGTVPPSLAFIAATDGTQTFCPTIANTGSASLSVSLAIGQAPGASANFANYYEIVPLALCPGGGAAPVACLATATPIAVGGGFNVAAGATCRLPLRFDPGQFGFPGGTGPRSARLTVTHNAPTAGQVVTYTLAGNVTAGPEPAIGIATNPGANAGGRVVPAVFSNQVINTPSAAWSEFLVSNIGDADGLDITEVSQTNAAEFALSGNCVSVAPLARLVGGAPTCAVGVVFTPNGLGERCTTVTIKAAFSSNGNQQATICGVGKPVPIPRLVAAPTSLDFGPRSIGNVYPPISLVVRNDATATADLQLGAITLSGAGFVLVPDASPCQNRLLAVGASCTLQIQFSPDPARPDTAYAASLRVDSNDPATPQWNVALTAIARAFAVPVLVWQATPATLSFPGPVIAAQQSPTTLSARLANVDGPGGVDIQAVRLVGADASSFAASSCPALLYQGQFCDISLTFLPGSGGFKTAQLQVVSANGSVPAPLTLEGQAVAGTSTRLIVSTDVLAFGRVRLGARSEPLVVTLAAGGDGVLKVTAIEADAPFSVVSQTCPPVPFTLPLGSDCSVTVSFIPAATDAASAKLRILTDASAQATEVGLDGVGQPAPDVSGGGCSLASGKSMIDPTLWLLALLAMGVIAYRQRTDRVAGRSANRRRRRSRRGTGE